MICDIMIMIQSFRGGARPIPTSHFTTKTTTTTIGPSLDSNMNTLNTHHTKRPKFPSRRTAIRLYPKNRGAHRIQQSRKDLYKGSSGTIKKSNRDSKQRDVVIGVGKEREVTRKQYTEVVNRGEQGEVLWVSMWGSSSPLAVLPICASNTTTASFDTLRFCRCTRFLFCYYCPAQLTSCTGTRIHFATSQSKRSPHSLHVRSRSSHDRDTPSSFVASLHESLIHAPQQL